MYTETLEHEYEKPYLGVPFAINPSIIKTADLKKEPRKEPEDDIKVIKE